MAPGVAALYLPSMPASPAIAPDRARARRISARVVVISLGLWSLTEGLAPALADAGSSAPQRRATASRRARAARKSSRCPRSRARCRRRGRRRGTAAASVPSAPPAGPTGPRSVVIDVSDQRLYQFENGAPVGVLPVSTGTERPYRQGRRTYIAHTPRGNFRIGRKIQGYRRSRLGTLYFPSYFVGGYAIHGGQLPGYPASHGCVRIPMSAARGFYDWAGPGTAVTVQD